MSLAVLAELACPVMMIACMAPMFRKDKNKDGQVQRQQKVQDVQPVTTNSQNEIQALQLQIADLMEENHKLKNQDQLAVNEDNDLHIVEGGRERKAMS